MKNTKAIAGALIVSVLTASSALAGPVNVAVGDVTGDGTDLTGNLDRDIIRRAAEDTAQPKPENAAKPDKKPRPRRAHLLVPAVQKVAPAQPQQEGR